MKTFWLIIIQLELDHVEYFKTWTYNPDSSGINFLDHGLNIVLISHHLDHDLVFWWIIIMWTSDTCSNVYVCRRNKQLGYSVLFLSYNILYGRDNTKYLNISRVQDFLELIE